MTVPRRTPQPGEALRRTTAARLDDIEHQLARVAQGQLRLARLFGDLIEAAQQDVDEQRRGQERIASRKDRLRLV